MRAVVITGVSRGLGAALFDALYERGDRLFAIGRRFTEAQQGLAATDPDRVLLRHADLGVPDEVPDAVELADFLRDSPAVLIHNAGVVEPIGAVGALPRDQIATAVAVNLTAPLLLTNGFLAAAERSEQVRVLFVSSGAAHRVVEGWATYCATKAGGEMLFDAVAEQYRDDPRVEVDNVNPGVMDTDMQAAIRGSTSGYFPDRERYLGLYERGQLPSPAEVAARIVAQHLTGE